MSTGKQEFNILAMITPSREAVGGGQPIVYANSSEQAESLSREVARALRADTFKLSNGAYLIVPTQR